MDALHIIAENKINAAILNGDFDELSGKGKPVHLDPQVLENGEQFLTNHLLKNNGFLPDWLGERKILLDEIQTLNCALSESPGEVDYCRETIQQLNRRISGYNLRVPIAAMQLQLLPIQK